MINLRSGRFLPFVALQTDIDRVNEAADTVYLMTLHNAKGLEFECVFITGLEQELLPHLRSMNSKYSIEEERRLLYVGVTRAKSRLFLSYAKYRENMTAFILLNRVSFFRNLTQIFLLVIMMQSLLSLNQLTRFMLSQNFK